MGSIGCWILTGVLEIPDVYVLLKNIKDCVQLQQTKVVLQYGIEIPEKDEINCKEEMRI